MHSASIFLSFQAGQPRHHTLLLRRRRCVLPRCKGKERQKQQQLFFSRCCVFFALPLSFSLALTQLPRC